jgi:hypothetical protein
MLRIKTFVLLGFSVFSLRPLWAQVEIHKFSLQELSFEYIPRVSSQNRCLQWGDVEDREPTIEYTAAGKMFLRAVVKARYAKPCPIRVEPSAGVKVESDGDNLIFEFTVHPPLARYIVRGPNFEDEVILEAPVRRLEEANFFNFFKRSQSYFDTRYSVLKTDNTEVIASRRTQKVFPVVGGHISVPFPWWQNLLFGMEMYQNVSNVLGQSGSRVTYSELAFDMAFQWLGSERAGRPRVSLVADVRGRNNVQRSNSANLSLTFAFSPGVGMDAMWFPLTSASPTWQKLGIEATGRFYPRTENNQRSYTSSLYGGGLIYRLDRKWALGLGYSQTRYTLDFSKNRLGGLQSVVKEKIDTVFLRLHLMPYLYEEQR